MAHQPGTAARAELTYAGDAAVEPGLASAAEAELDRRSPDEVAQLSDLGRKALGQLSAGNSDALDATVTEGEDARVDDRAAHDRDIRHSSRRCPAWVRTAELTLSPGASAAATRSRSRRSTRRRPRARRGRRLAVSSAAASRITTLLTEHDTTTADAAAAGRQEKYADALAKLDESDRLMAQVAGVQVTRFANRSTSRR